MNTINQPGLPDIPAGEIIVAPRAIASTAARVACRVPGLAGLARVAADRTAVVVPPEQAAEVVRVLIQEAQLQIEVPVVLLYDAPMAEVSARIEQAISRALEQALGRAPDQVTVQVLGVV